MQHLVLYFYQVNLVQFYLTFNYLFLYKKRLPIIDSLLSVKFVELQLTQIYSFYSIFCYFYYSLRNC
nr:MAG TPA: hypothetical protein [Caudoviricetes sp.]